MSRVLVFCGDKGIPWAGPSGAASHLRGIASALKHRGEEVVVATPRWNDHRGTVATPDLTSQHTSPRRWPSWMKEIGETHDARRLIGETLQRHGPFDWIWERHALGVDAGARLARRNKIPRLVELNAPLTLERTRYGRLRWPKRAARLEQKTLRSADRIVTVSSWLAQWAVDQGCDPDHVRHVPNGTSLKPSKRRQETRHALNLTGLVVGFVGGLRPWHGLAFLGEVLELLPNATFLVVGSGPCSLPSHSRLTHLPWVETNRLAHVIAAMDVALAPYEANAAPWFGPLKIPDYQSQGVPTVASSHGDAQALVNGQGLTLPTLDPRSWADAILELQGIRFPVDVRSWGQVANESLIGFSVPCSTPPDHTSGYSLDPRSC